jgi:protein bicaudal C
MARHDVFISSRPKARQSTMCIVIKGIEKFCSNIYDARHELLKLTSERIKAAIPLTYYGPNDMENFKNSNIAQLVTSSMTYTSMSPLQIPQVPWQVSPELSWRSQIPAPPPSPLTQSMLQQHNQITQMNNMPIPSISINASEYHSSGYSTLNSDSSMVKSGSSLNSSSHNSSPENSINYGNNKFATPTNMPAYMEQALHSQSIRAMNDLSYSLDPRITAGLRAMNMTPTQNETRSPTSACKSTLIN